MNEKSVGTTDFQDQIEYYQMLMSAPIYDLADYLGKDIDTAVAMRIEAVKATNSLKLDVSVRLLTDKGNCVAMANVKINNSFVVDGFKIMNGENGLYIKNPNKADNKGEYRDTSRPITKEFRNELYGAIMKAYREAIEKVQNISATIPEPEPKQTMNQQIKNGAKQAAKHNASKPVPTTPNHANENR